MLCTSFRQDFIDYSARDASSTWALREFLARALKGEITDEKGGLPEHIEANKKAVALREQEELSEAATAAAGKGRTFKGLGKEQGHWHRQIVQRKHPLPNMRWFIDDPTNDCGTMWDFYLAYWLPFATCLTDMARRDFAEHFFGSNAL